MFGSLYDTTKKTQKIGTLLKIWMVIYQQALYDIPK